MIFERYRSYQGLFFRRAFLVGLLLCAFCAAWGHVHGPGQDQDHRYPCLLCQWVKTSVSIAYIPPSLPVLPASGTIPLLSHPTTSQIPLDFPCGRSPPSASPF